jgi:hypothetical protein
VETVWLEIKVRPLVGGAAQVGAEEPAEVKTCPDEPAAVDA